MIQPPIAQKTPHGPALSCKGWPQEAALRLFLNSCDPEVAERRHESEPGSQNGKALAGSDESQSLVAALQELPGDQTLFVQTGKSAGVYRVATVAIKDAPSVLIAVVQNQSASHAGNLYRFSQISAASWFYVGCQGALQATHELLGFATSRNFGGTLAGKLVVACGLGAVGGAQPLAATLRGGAALGIDADGERIKQRVKSGYCEIMVNDLDEALRILKNSVRRREPASVALIGDCDKVIPELASRGIVPDLLLPNFRERSRSTENGTPGIAELQNLGAVLLDGETFDPDAGTASGGADDGTSRITADSEPVTFIALSGSRADIARADRALLEVFPANEPLQHWLPIAKKHIRFQGLPARVIWLNAVGRLQFSLALNDLASRGELQAPIVIACAELRLTQTPDATSGNKPSTPLTARDKIQIESVVEAPSQQARGACLAAVDPLAAQGHVAGAVIADGTSTASERINSAFSGGPRQGVPDAL